MFHLFILASILARVAANFGGCCGVALPPPCPPPPPPPMCLPQPPPCPPPPICPPQFCPPPPMCPPPPPPPPPPMCPPPLPPPPPAPCMSYAPQPAFPQYVQPPANDCCCRCGSPCAFRARRARTLGSKLFDLSHEQEEDLDPTCSSRKLRQVLIDNMTTNPSETKRAVQKAAEEKLFGKFNVICAAGDFSYVAYTDTYCQHSNGDVTCYVFRPM